jgi:hypothetical protein
MPPSPFTGKFWGLYRYMVHEYLLLEKILASAMDTINTMTKQWLSLSRSDENLGTNPAIHLLFLVRSL